jgi:alpha-mannosidase
LRQLYTELFETGKKVLKDIYKVLGLSNTTSKSLGDLVALNTLPWPRKEIVDISSKECCVACGNGNFLSVKPFKVTNKPQVSVREVENDIFVLENDQLRVKVDGGHITSLYDLQNGREIIPDGGKANQMVLYDDKPLYWQAWDVELYHLDSRKELPSSQTTIVETGQHRVSVMTETKISTESWIKTTISLSAAFDGCQSYVEMSAEVEWHETMKFLKVEFPVDIRNAEASYETQFGIVKRPTHYNTRYGMPHVL